jgi:hypothetical protein
MDSEALILASIYPDRQYHSLIAEIKFPVPSEPNMKEGAEKSPGFRRMDG